MVNKRVFSHYTKDAALLLGQLIKAGRFEKKMTAKDLASRAGISRGTIQKIEQGHLSCELGLVFEVAMIVGVRLFETNKTSISHLLDITTNKITLLPQRVRHTHEDLDDNF
ncbi:MAG: helix-turn-helix domain-containing protein [Legionellales bacterium]|nr:helix-turn-helix domain-containing protein [Legionellales bacterium]